MITVGWTYADGTVGPANRGVRLAYGPFGFADEFLGSAEFWIAFREGGKQSITSVGACMVPVSFRYRRLGWGPLFDVGLRQFKEEGNVVLAGIVGVGPELVVRLARRWDLAATAEIDYVTTLDSELQLRLAVRYHHERISAWKEH
jgi:hypothetical protein